MKLFNKLYLKYFIISLPLYLLIFFWTQRLHHTRFDRQLEKLIGYHKNGIATSSAQIEYSLNSALQDLNFLATSIDYSQLDRPDIRQHIAATYCAFADTYHTYDQISFCDPTGQEIVHISRHQAAAKQTPEKKLRNHSDSTDIIKLSNASENEPHISILHDKTNTNSDKPVLRIGLPIFNGTQRLGMVIIRYPLHPLLKKIHYPNAMLISEDRNWLEYAFSNKSQDLPIHISPSIATTFPEEWAYISTHDEGTLRTEKGVFKFKKLTPVSAQMRNEYNAATVFPTWTLIRHINATTLAKIEHTISHELSPLIITLYSSLFIIFLLLTISRSFALKSAIKNTRSERQYRDLFDNMTNGFALHEMIYNDAGDPVDYRFLKINHAFEVLTGFDADKMIGHTAKELLPETEQFWIQNFHTVVTSGQSIRVEHFSKEFNKYYEVVAYKAGPNQFAALASDVTEARFIREAAERQANELQSVFDTTGAGLLITNNRGLIINANIALRNLFGYPQAELINKSYLDLVPEEMRQTATKRLERLQSGESIVASEALGRTKEGQILTLLINMHPFKNSQTNASQFVISIIDITDHKKAERKAAELSERLSMATHAAGLGVWDWDLTEKRIVWDDRMYELYGSDRTEFNTPYDTWYARIHPDDLKRTRKEMLAAVKSDVICHITFRIIHPDKSIHYLHASAEMHRDAAGRPFRFVGINRDITDLKVAENERIANEQRYRFLSDASHESVILCRNGIIIQANQHFLDLAGRTQQELHDGISLDAILDPTLLQTDQTVTINLQPIKTRQTQSIVAEVSLMHREYQNGKVDVLVIRDVSAQKETEEMLILAKMRAEAANRAKSEFLTTMSHELRTPMNGIIGMTQLIGDSELNEEQREYLDIVIDSSRALLEIINDLLDLARIESGRITLQNHPVDLYETALQVVERLRPQALNKKIDITFSYDPNLPRAFTGDEVRLRQILLNLMGNAVKFTESGHVQLAIQTEAISKEDVLVRIKVTDTGIGIPEGYLDFIFEKFTQVDQSDTRRHDGTGLGLNITKRLVELMEGDLTCESTIDQGSCFTVVILLQLPVDQSNDTYCANKKLPPLNILLADNNLTNRLAAEHLLNKMGCSTVHVCNGKDALPLAMDKEFDLILVDINMPEIDGFEATRRLRAAGVETPIIALSAHAMDTDRATCIAAGMNDYFARPIDREHLFRALNKIAITESKRSDAAV